MPAAAWPAGAGPVNPIAAGVTYQADQTMTDWTMLPISSLRRVRAQNVPARPQAAPGLRATPGAGAIARCPRSAGHAQAAAQRLAAWLSRRVRPLTDRWRGGRTAALLEQILRDPHPAGIANCVQQLGAIHGHHGGGFDDRQLAQLRASIGALPYAQVQELRTVLRGPGAAQAQRKMQSEQDVAAELMLVQLAQLTMAMRTLPATMRAIYQHKIERRPSDDEQAKLTLPGGLSVSAVFVRDTLRTLDCRLPDGRALLDYADWFRLSEAEKLARIEAGARQLLPLCGGDGTTLAAITVLAHQALMTPFLQAFSDPALPGYPQWCPGGLIGSCLNSGLRPTITFHGTADEIWLELNAVLEGPSTGVAVLLSDPAGQRGIYRLPPQTQIVVRGSFTLRDRVTGQLAMREAPSFLIDVPQVPELIERDGM